MEQRPLILFGNFSEHETHEYFSHESLKSCGIEFPDDLILPFEANDITLFEASEAGKKTVLCSEDDYCIDKKKAGKNREADLGEKKSDENHENEQYDSEYDISINGDTLPCETKLTNQVSDNVVNVVDNEVTVYPENINAISEEKCDIVPQNDQKFTQEQDSSLSEKTVPEQNGEAQQAANVAQPTNVVTMGTQTMATNTTTVGSGHHKPETNKGTWADLFKTKSSSKPQAPHQPTIILKEPEATTITESSNKDQFKHYFIDVLKKTVLTNQIPHLQPRGLKNNANWCYINATLQVLIFCPSFYHFVARFRVKTDRGKSCTPILDALVLFVSQFGKMPARQSGGNKDWGKQDVVMGMPFEPTYIYDLLTLVKTTLSQQGKQEDAEEFLSFILNGIHEELVHLESPEDKQEPDGSNNHLVTSKVNEESVGDWEEVGPRNKSTVTRKSTMMKSPIGKMFGGYLRSSLVQPGMKESASIQPFYSIQLDLRGDVATVQQAFDHFFSVEEVEGFQCDKSKMEVEVSKKWTLDSLPLVLILHLKRFVVNKTGCEKLTKKVSYESELQISQDTLSKSLKIRNKNMLTYKLFAVTYHHGKHLHGGHYTSDIFHPAVGWLRADDINIRLIPTKFVLTPLSNRDPYLLYYRRGDILV